MTQAQKRRPSRGRNRNTGRVRRRVLRGLLALVLIILALAGGIFARFYFTSHTVRDAVAAMLSGEISPSRAFPGQDEINLLFMGRDQDRDNRDQVVHTRGRSDAIMLAHIDFRNRQANILSVPRDTLVRIPGYRGKRRINSANALGGPELARDTIFDFLNVKPDYYILVDFAGFQEAIDAIGGLDINVDKQLDYDDNWGNLHIHLKPGQQWLNGEQAMGFVRFRHSADGNSDSDFVRIGRQQEFLRAMKSRISNPAVLMKVPSAIDTVRDNMEGNLSTSQIMCLAHFLKSLPQDSGIHFETLPAAPGGGNYVRADMDATKELVGRMFHSAQQQ